MLAGPDALPVTDTIPPLTTDSPALALSPACSTPLTTSWPPFVPAASEPLSSVTVEAVSCPMIDHAAAENAIVLVEPVPLIPPPPVAKFAVSPALGTVALLQLVATSKGPPAPLLEFSHV